MNPLKPNTSLLMKLGSIAVHADKFFSTSSITNNAPIATALHEFDRATIISLLTDQEVQEWMKKMSALSLLPRKR